MKKILLTLLTLLVLNTLKAQTFVLYKDGKVLEQFDSDQVDSIVYNPEVHMARLSGVQLIDDYQMTSTNDFRSLVKNAGTVFPVMSEVEWGATLSKNELPKTWLSVKDTKPTSTGEWAVWYRITSNIQGYTNHNATKVGEVKVYPYFDSTTDRNIYYDAACTQLMFDASKVVIGKDSIDDETWLNNNPQYFVDIPVQTIVMKVPFEVFNNYGEFVGTAKYSENYNVYYVTGVFYSGFKFIILAKR